MSLSAKEIYGYARGAGFNPAQAVVATAVALAESTGNPTSHCLNCFPGVTEDSRGLWQINVDAHPQYKSWNLFDPATNAKAAYEVSSAGKSFAPWSTYTNGAYRSHLAAAGGAAGSDPITGPIQRSGGDTAAASTTPGMTTSGVGLNLNPLDGFGLFSSIKNSLAQDVYRITVTGVLIAGGAALVVVGLLRSVQPTVQKVAQVAGPIAKAAAA